MKSIIVISKGRNTLRAFCGQMHRLFGRAAKVTGYCEEDLLPNDLSGDLILVSSQQVYQRVKGQLPAACPLVIARRSINYHEVGKLFNIPAGTDVLLVNDMASSAEQTVAQLLTLGIDHIHYQPYSPDAPRYPRLPIAITPGERELVPDCVERVVDIGVRLIDVSTLVEILIRLDLLNMYADLLSVNFVKDMVFLIKSSTKMMHASNKVKRQLQTIINSVHDGIIATDDEGEISVFNPVAEELLDMRARHALGRAPRLLTNGALLRVLGEAKEDREVLVKTDRHHLLVNVAKLRPEQAGSGKVFTFKDVSEIRRMEETVRRKLIHEQKIARYTFDHMIGESEAIRRALSIAEKMAKSNSTILIQGESGTGKEIVAQGIHNASPRRGGPFIAVNFAAMTENLLESELFGYTAGAFTGAGRNGAPGLFEEAHKGTIFLDEIGDAPLPFQVKLLRVLQEQQLRRVGSAKVIPIDVRVIVATNRDLKRLIAEGAFRQDLYYRLNVLPIQMPPLRARGEDILLLAKYFYRSRSAAFGGEDYFRWIAPQLLRYHWPGNIRQLQNVVEYLVNICPGEPPTSELLPDELKEDALSRPSPQEESSRLKCRVYDEILRANLQDRSIGRRSLAQHLRVPENRIRAVLRQMQADGDVVLQKGRKGLKICKEDAAADLAK